MACLMKANPYLTTAIINNICKNIIKVECLTLTYSVIRSDSRPTIAGKLHTIVMKKVIYGLLDESEFIFDNCYNYNL